MENKDYVNHPSHYTDGKIEVIDYIEDKKLNYHLGNVVKYVSRAGKKDGNDPVQDLKKALWYLNREIDRREKENALKEKLSTKNKEDNWYTVEIVNYNK